MLLNTPVNVAYHDDVVEEFEAATASYTLFVDRLTMATRDIKAGDIILLERGNLKEKSNIRKLTNSCIPNVALYQTRRLTCVVFAMMDIDKGEEITIDHFEGEYYEDKDDPELHKVLYGHIIPPDGYCKCGGCISIQHYEVFKKCITPIIEALQHDDTVSLKEIREHLSDYEFLLFSRVFLSDPNACIEREIVNGAVRRADVLKKNNNKGFSLEWVILMRDIFYAYNDFAHINILSTMLVCNGFYTEGAYLPIPLLLLYRDTYRKAKNDIVADNIDMAIRHTRTLRNKVRKVMQRMCIK